jgi:hypothetical protein
MAAPVLIMGGEDCPESVCTDYSYDEDMLEATVTGLTEFYLEDRQRCGDDRCNGNENCSTCPQDCGQCRVQATEESGECTPRWNCSQWSECERGVMTRLCSDVNGCNESVTQEQGCKEVQPEQESEPIEEKLPPVPEKPVKTRGPIWQWILIGACAVVGFVFIARTQLRRTRKGHAPKKHTHPINHPERSGPVPARHAVHRPDIMYMIVQHDRYGFQPHHIKHSLGKKGYPHEEHHLVDIYFYLKEGITKGHTAVALKHALISSGWHPLHVEKAFKALMQHMFSQGRPR